MLFAIYHTPFTSCHIYVCLTPNAAGETIIVNITAVNGVGLKLTGSSNGVFIDPTSPIVTGAIDHVNYIL
jgi:hypothetical protein